MLKMLEKKNNDKGELIDRTAWFIRLRAHIHVYHTQISDNGNCCLKYQNVDHVTHSFVIIVF